VRVPQNSAEFCKFCISTQVTSWARAAHPHRLDAVAHTVRYLERPLARLAPGQRWEMVSHFIGWVIDARPRAALAMLVAATPPAPAKHIASGTAVPQLHRERGMLTIGMLVCLPSVSLRTNALTCSCCPLLCDAV